MAKWILKAAKNLSAELVGQKAAHLSYLMMHGYRVPPAVFVPLFALQETLKTNNLWHEFYALARPGALPDFSSQELKRLRRKMEAMSLPSAFRQELQSLLTHWQKEGLQRLAVRSSAAGEDLGNQSFAGQYETVLDVPLQLEDVEQAIRRVWASLFAHRVSSYVRENTRPLPAQAMGVILQKMVPARFAGVAFSQNPLQPENEELILEYVSGSGRQLVDGLVTPQRLIFSREKIIAGTADFRQAGKELPKIAAFVQTVLRLEKQVGQPVDVEWVFDGQTYYFLQFRPITALQRGIIWSDENVGEVIPDVVTPFSWSILQPMTNGAYRYFLRRLGLSMPKEPLFTLYEGKVYFNQNAFRKVLNAFYLSTYLSPEKKFRITTLPALLKPAYLYLRLGFFLLRLPYKIWPWNRAVPDHVIFNGALTSPRDFVKEIRRLLRWANKIMNYHISVTIFAEIYYQALDKLCKVWCSDLNIKASGLLQGIGDVESTQPARALWEIGQWIRQNDRYREKFSQLTVDELQVWLDNLPRRDPLRKALDLFFEHYGHGALHEFELIYPRWQEDPGYILQSLRNYARYRRNGFDLQERLRSLEKERIAITQKTLEYLKKQSRWKYKLFRHLLKKAQYFSLERELLKQQIVRLFFGLKRHLVAVSRHFFDDDQSVFYLTWPEVQRLVKGQLSGKELTLKIQQRRLLRNKQMEMVHPARIKQVGTRWIPLEEAGTAGEHLRGIPCSPGIVEGRVRVVLNIDQGAQFEKGEILVTRATNPGWTPMMVLAGGIITEIGGALSHGAIIAREFGIPMIAAVSGITELLKSGQWVRMNGQTGTIERLEED